MIPVFSFSRLKIIIKIPVIKQITQIATKIKYKIIVYQVSFKPPKLFKQIPKPIIKQITEPITKANPILRNFLLIAVTISPSIKKKWTSNNKKFRQNDMKIFQNI